MADPRRRETDNARLLFIDAKCQTIGVLSKVFSPETRLDLRVASSSIGYPRAGCFYREVFVRNRAGRSMGKAYNWRGFFHGLPGSNQEATDRLSHLRRCEEP